MEERPTVTLKISRFNPRTDRAPRYREYQVPWRPGLSVLEALRYLHSCVDSTLAFYDYSCGLGRCQGCLLEINGRTQRGCQYLLDRDSIATVGPPQGYPVIRDLRVDFGVPTRSGPSGDLRWTGDGAQVGLPQTPSAAELG